MNKKLMRIFKQRKITAYRLSLDTGLSQSTIHRWIAGTDISIGNAEKIAKVLKVKFILEVKG